MPAGPRTSTAAVPRATAACAWAIATASSASRPTNGGSRRPMPGGALVVQRPRAGARLQAQLTDHGDAQALVGADGDVPLAGVDRHAHERAAGRLVAKGRPRARAPTVRRGAAARRACPARVGAAPAPTPRTERRAAARRRSCRRPARRRPRRRRAARARPRRGTAGRRRSTAGPGTARPARRAARPPAGRPACAAPGGPPCAGWPRPRRRPGAASSCSMTRSRGARWRSLRASRATSSCARRVDQSASVTSAFPARTRKRPRTSMRTSPVTAPPRIMTGARRHRPG